MKVQMEPAEVAIAEMLAVMRNAANRGNHVADKQKGDQNPIQIERDGVLAEMAFGKAYNLWPDFSIMPRHGGADLTGKTGKTIDVKATRYKSGRLLIHTDKEPGAVDLYVLAIVEDSTIDLVGYIESDKAIHPDNLGDVGHGQTYVVERERLVAL